MPVLNHWIGFAQEDLDRLALLAIHIDFEKEIHFPAYVKLLLKASKIRKLFGLEKKEPFHCCCNTMTTDHIEMSIMGLIGLHGIHLIELA